jgi:predicted DNA-binding protein
MPTEKGDKMAMTIWLDKSLVARLDQLAKKGELTRSKLVANIIEVGVEELEVMNKFGVWAVARIFENWKQRLRGKEKKRKKASDSSRG